jgi:hypothetical protein
MPFNLVFFCFLLDLSVISSSISKYCGFALKLCCYDQCILSQYYVDCLRLPFCLQAGQALHATEGVNIYLERLDLQGSQLCDVGEISLILLVGAGQST